MYIMCNVHICGNFLFNNSQNPAPIEISENIHPSWFLSIAILIGLSSDWFLSLGIIGEGHAMQVPSVKLERFP